MKTLDPSPADLIHGDGIMAGRIRAYAWSGSPLGPMPHWPPELLTMVNLILSSPIAMQIFWGPDMTVLHNDSMAAFTQGKDALGRPARQVWAEAWAKIAPQLQGVLAHGQPVNLQHVFLPLLQHGVLQDMYWNYTFTPIVDPRGQVTGILNFAQDVTETVHAQRHLKASEAQAVRILQSIGDAVIVTDAAGNITRMNPVAEKLTAWRSQEAHGKPLASVFQILSEDTRQPTETPADKLGRTGKVVGHSHHTLLVNRDGAEIAIDDSGAPIRDDNGNLTGIVLVFRDVAQQRAYQRDVRATAEVQTLLLALTDRQGKATGARDIMSAASELLGSYLQASRVGYAEAAQQPDSMLFETGWTRPGLQPLTGRVVLDHYGATITREFSLGNSVVYADVDLEPHLQAELPNYRQIETRSLVAVPFVRAGTWIGSFYVNDSVPRQWTPRQVALVQEVARRTSSAVERARAEDAERRTEEHLRLAVDAADLAAWFYDPAMSVLGGDARMAELFGLSQIHAPLERWLEFIHPDDRDRVAQEFSTAVGGAPYTTEYRILIPGNTPRWVRAKAQLLQEAGTSRLVGICEDITVRKRTEEDLRSIASRLGLAQQTARLAAWQWDLATGDFIWDGGSEWTYGRPAQDLSHVDRILPLLHEEDRDRVRRELEPVLHHGQDFHSEFRVVWPDSSVHWLQGIGKVLPAANGAAASLLGINMDITERKLSESALLQNEKLAAVGRLAASIAHEINNPLESVTNLIYLARYSDTLSESQEYLDTAERELRRVSAITNQTLRFHRQSTAPAPTFCSDLFGDTLSIYQGRLVNSHIRIEKRKRAEKPVNCLSGEIRQVLSNLIGNAIDSMQTGGTLFVRSREATNWHTGRTGVVLTVADTGTGMDAAVQKKIFDAFFTTKGIGGTGLGLWISTEIVARHGGTLRLRSSRHPVHHGTTFTIFLPFTSPLL